MVCIPWPSHLWVQRRGWPQTCRTELLTRCCLLLYLWSRQVVVLLCGHCLVLCLVYYPKPINGRVMLLWQLIFGWIVSVSSWLRSSVFASGSFLWSTLLPEISVFIARTSACIFSGFLCRLSFSFVSPLPGGHMGVGNGLRWVLLFANFDFSLLLG